MLIQDKGMCRKDEICLDEQKNMKLIELELRISKDENLIKS